MRSIESKFPFFSLLAGSDVCNLILSYSAQNPSSITKSFLLSILTVRALFIPVTASWPSYNSLIFRSIGVSWDKADAAKRIPEISRRLI